MDHPNHFKLYPFLWEKFMYVFYFSGGIIIKSEKRGPKPKRKKKKKKKLGSVKYICFCRLSILVFFTFLLRLLWRSSRTGSPFLSAFEDDDDGENYEEEVVLVVARSDYGESFSFGAIPKRPSEALGVPLVFVFFGRQLFPFSHRF